MFKKKVKGSPYVVEYIEHSYDEDYAYIFMELIEGENLADLHVRMGCFAEAEARFFFNKMLAAVEYCHEQGVCHHDIKLEHFVCLPNFELKLLDFGFSAKLGQKLNHFVGSPLYNAPELFLSQPHDGTKSDIYALGVVLYVLLCDSFPKDGESYLELMKQVTDQNSTIVYPPSLSPEVVDLIDKMLRFSPDERITLSEIKHHHWIRNSSATPKRTKSSLRRSPSFKAITFTSFT